MTTLTREVWINAPTEKVWTILADFGNIAVFNPGVPRSYLTSRQQQGVGATRHCDLSLAGAAVEERIIAWTEGESIQIEIYQGTKTPPFKKAVATLTVTEEKDGTRVRGDLAYSLKLGPLGFLMDKLMVAPQFGKKTGPAFWPVSNITRKPASRSKGREGLILSRWPWWPDGTTLDKRKQDQSGLKDLTGLPYF